MLTFEAFTKMGYTAYTLSESSRRDLLKHFEPKNPEVICHHVTYQFPASVGDLPPAVREAHVVGYAEKDGLEALVVEINGNTKRPDGKLFHVTLSLDRTKKIKPVHSNDLVASGYKHVAPIAIHLTPAYLT
jgi:hypothetical protein